MYFFKKYFHKINKQVTVHLPDFRDIILESFFENINVLGYWCTNRHFDKNIGGLLFFHHFHLKIWLS